MTDEKRTGRSQTDPKDVPTDRTRTEKTSKGTERQVAEEEEKGKVTGAW